MNKEDQFLEFANLDSSLFQLSTLEERKISSNLTGKPTKISKDIAKRFFTNPTAAVATCVFLIVILMSIFIPLFSRYLPEAKIYPIESLWVTNVPPIFNKVVQEQITNSQIGLFINLLETKELFPDFSANIDISSHGLIQSDADLLVKGSNGIIKNIIVLPEKNYLIEYDKYRMIQCVLAQKQLIGENITNNPLSEHVFTLFGTDSLGYDIWTRTWAATRDSLSLAIVVVIFEAFIGIAIGSYLGFFVGTWIDTILTRFIDIVRNIPITLWFLIIISFFKEANFLTLFIALIAVGWTSPVYSTRLWMITVKDQEFIKASKSIGAGTNRLIFLHALPLIIGKLLTSFVWRIINVIFLVSSLSFLGFMSSGNFIDLGQILQSAIAQSKFNIWALVLPTVILLLISLSAQFIANGLHDALDPKVLKGAK